MALEEAIKALIEATLALTQETKDLKALRADAIESTRKAAGAAATSTKAADKAPATTTAAVVDDAAVTALRTKAKGLQQEFVKGTTREEERKARTDKVKFLLRHETLVRPEVLTTPPTNAAGQETFSVADVRDDALLKLIKNLEKLIKEGDLTKPPAAAADDDGDLL